LNGMMQRPSRAQLFEKGVVQCLWLLGRKDNYINCDTITKSLTLPDNVTVVILEESGHLGFIEEEDRSLNTIVKFIDSSETQPRT
jgi:predicted alpha/beta-fold hydrolase